MRERSPNIVKVEKGIPIPGRQDSVIEEYPFGELEIGDSFKLKAHHAENASGRCYRAQKKYQGRKFIFRKTSDGVRIWRSE